MGQKVIDLFAGVGGLSLGFEQCGFDVVLANEYEPSIANAYKENHINTEVLVGDITQLDLDATFGKFKGNIDVVIGGPPCQVFSKGAKKNNTRSKKFFV